MATRPFGTCFFEQYAQISLSALLGSEFEGLVNLDRPDLQSPDGKSVGIEVTRAEEIAAKAAGYPGLRVKGLMCIPPFDADDKKTRNYFQTMYNLFIDIKAKKYDNVSMNILSMGMSGDFPLAIAEGANMVRVGTGIFGMRQYHK